jgi:hypothetical protein
MQPPTRSTDNVWESVKPSSVAGTPAIRLYDGSPHAVIRLDKAALDQIFARAPHEDSAGEPQPALTLPLPDGRFAGFRITQTDVLSPALAAAYPQFKTFRGVAVGDPASTARIDWTADGFHALVLTAGETIVVDPYVKGNPTIYISYFKTGAVKEPRDNR